MQYRENENKSLIRYSFDSLAELARWIDTSPRTWHGVTDSQRQPPSKSWDLEAGYETALELAKFGWREGAQRSQRTLAALRSDTPAPSEKVDFYGYRPHVPRYCAGAPDNMIRKSTEKGEGKVIVLYVPVNANAAVGAQCMERFGLAVSQYVRQLELEGNRVELHGAFVSQVSPRRVVRLSCTWCIKRADQPLDLGVVSFAIGHPAMFRRIGFAFRERSTAPRTPDYGSSRDLVLSDLINAPTGAKIINGMKDADDFADIEAAIRYIEKQVKE